MATNEEILNPKWLVVPSVVLANQEATAPAGSIAISGATLVFFNGTIWQKSSEAS